MKVEYMYYAVFILLYMYVCGDDCGDYSTFGEIMIGMIKMRLWTI
jgi:hypothetical protein